MENIRHGNGKVKMKSRSINSLIKEARNELYLYNEKHDWKGYFSRFIDQLETALKEKKEKDRKAAEKAKENAKINADLESQLNCARRMCNHLREISDKDYAFNWEY